MRRLFSYLMALAIATVWVLAFLAALPAHAGTPMHWDCTNVAARGVAFKGQGFSGDTGGVSGGLPDSSALAIVSTDAQRRFFRVFLYDGVRGGQVIYMPFDSGLPITDAGPDGMYQNRVNPQGNPVATYQDNQLKFFYSQWPGPGGAEGDLFRVNTGCALFP